MQVIILKTVHDDDGFSLVFYTFNVYFCAASLFSYRRIDGTLFQCLFGANIGWSHHLGS